MSHLLLIEDDPIMGESLVDRFELEGLAVLWVRTVAQAELRLRDARFDAVVSDVRLTDGSGEHLLRSWCARARCCPLALYYGLRLGGPGRCHASGGRARLRHETV